MKKLTGIIILMIISLWACRLEELDECEETATFERTYNEASDFGAKDIAATSDGGYVICGNVSDDIFLMKIDEQGDVIFYEQDVIPVTNETCRSIVVTPDGGFLICGERESKAYFATYDSAGKHLNQSRDTYTSSCNCITNTNDGRYVFSGRVQNTNNAYNTYVGFIQLVNTYPKILPTNYIPNPVDRMGAEYAYTVITIPGGYAVAGHSHNSPTADISNAVHFLKLDNNLVFMEEQFHDLGLQQNAARDIVKTDDGGFLLVGSLEAGQGPDIFVLKVDREGNIDTNGLHQYGGALKDFGTEIIASHENEKYIVCGYTTSFSTDNSDAVYLAKVNQDGSLVWETTYGQAGVDELAVSMLRADCGYIIVGTSISGGQHKPYVIKVDADGNVL